MRFTSPIFTMARGSLGGITFLATATQSLVARARVSPTQPHTTYQNMLRNAFKQAVGWWESATGVVMSAWASYAANIWLSGPMGPYQPTGRQLMCGNISMQQYLISRGATFTAAAHDMTIGATAYFTAPTVTVLPPSSGHTGFKIHVVNNSSAIGVFWVEISASYGISRNYFKGPFMASTLLSADIAGAANHDFVFDIGPALGVAFARVGVMDKATGQIRGIDQVLRADITTVA